MQWVIQQGGYERVMQKMFPRLVPVVSSWADNGVWVVRVFVRTKDTHMVFDEPPQDFPSETLLAKLHLLNQ